MDSRLALITGASGGIGEAFAEVLAADGYGLILIARRDQELHRVKGLILSKHDIPVHVVALDLSATGSVEKLSAELASRNLVPQLVVNNAGFGLMGSAHQISRDDQLNMIDLNVRVLTDITLRYLPPMVAAKAGGIINVASVAGFMPGPLMAVYFATKNYVVSFGDALSAELRGSGVTITTLCPGAVKTGFQSRAGMKKSLISGKSSAEVARDAYAAFKTGKRVVIPGVLNLVSAYMMRCMPRRVTLPIMRQVMGRMRQT